MPICGEVSRNRFPKDEGLPYLAVGQQTFPYRIMEAMQKLTSQFESRFLRAVSDYRCEITGVKFLAGLLSH